MKPKKGIPSNESAQHLQADLLGPTDPGLYAVSSLRYATSCEQVKLSEHPHRNHWFVPYACVTARGKNRSLLVEMVKLYCLILEVNYHFTVNVHLEDTVYDLKRAIKQETHPILESVAVNDLILWKVSCPEHHNLPLLCSEPVAVLEFYFK